MRRTCSLIRFRLAPVPTLMILLANSTPIVCDESVRHSFFTKRCNKHDLVEQVVSLPAAHCVDRIDGWRPYFPVPLGPNKMIFAR